MPSSVSASPVITDHHTYLGLPFFFLLITFEIVSHYIALAGLELAILLTQSPEGCGLILF